MSGIFLSNVSKYRFLNVQDYNSATIVTLANIIFYTAIKINIALKVGPYIVLFTDDEFAYLVS